jgi:hypothetical protein
MVKGLEVFRDHFQHYLDQYVLIGGAACDILMSEASLEFRVTKDLDIVLLIDVLDSAYISMFWEFIRLGDYQTRFSMSQQRSYRFSHPKNNSFPKMIELFSKKPNFLKIDDKDHLVKIESDDEFSDLSAILLDIDYYNLCIDGKFEKSGLSLVRAEYLIPLKAKAWIDLNQRKAEGMHIDSMDIRKHKYDIFRLFQIVDPEDKVSLPVKIRNDLSRFLDEMKNEELDLKNIGIPDEKKEIIESIFKFYN